MAVNVDETGNKQRRFLKDVINILRNGGEYQKIIQGGGNSSYAGNE